MRWSGTRTTRGKTVGEREQPRAWDVADRNIRRYLQGIERAKLGGKANIAVCREKIDKWLEYRRQHGPDDRSAEL